MHIHSKGYRTLIHFPSQYAFISVRNRQGVGKGWMLSWWARCRARNTYTRTSLTSKTPTHTQLKESVLSLLHSPLGPAFPFQCYPGVVEKKFSPLALSVWFPITRLKQTKPPSLLPLYVSYPHMYNQHNLCHLTHVTTEHAVQMRHFQNVQWRFIRNPFPR